MQYLYIFYFFKILFFYLDCFLKVFVEFVLVLLLLYVLFIWLEACARIETAPLALEGEVLATVLPVKCSL